MPRRPRKQSDSGIYHVMLRGINRQVIFEDDGDRHYFMTTLKTCKELSGFQLYAFCLMTNHVHLLMEPGEEPLDVIFKRIGSRFAGWYNRKYQRVGHLFQDRFRSENVETDEYFMTALRYILQNPMKAGMETRPGSYRWSSYQAYVKGSGSVTDTAFAMNLSGGRDQLIEFLNQVNDDTVMDEDSHEWRLSDEQAKAIIQEISGCSSASEFQCMDLSVQKKHTCELYLNRLTMGQISRLTGMSKTTVHRVIHASDPQLLAERMNIKLHEEMISEDWLCEEPW